MLAEKKKKEEARGKLTEFMNKLEERYLDPSQDGLLAPEAAAEECSLHSSQGGDKELPDVPEE